MQRHMVALVAAAVVLLVALVVLIVRIRTPQQAVAIDESEIRARAGERAPDPSRPGPPPPDKQLGEAESVAATQPPERSDRRTASGRSIVPVRPPGPADGAAGRRLPSDLPPDPSPGMIEKRLAVTDAYDRGDHEQALAVAEDFLRQQPDNPYVKRVAAVSACAIGDEGKARRHHQEMSEANRRIVARRCSRFGVDL